MTQAHQGGPDKLTWDVHYQRWLKAPKRALTEARKRTRDNSPGDWRWLEDGLSEPRKKYFVAEVFASQPVPKRLAAPMLRAGIYERDPSWNRGFIDPCVRSFGRRRVNEELIRYFESGTDLEKAGAASAFYWSFSSNPRNRTKLKEDVSDQWERVNHLFLREFVRNTDLHVRQRIIPHLDLSEDHYPEELKPLIQKAIKIARSHSDHYIRHRVEIQLGAGGPYMAIPSTDDEMAVDTSGRIVNVFRKMFGLQTRRKSDSK